MERISYQDIPEGMFEKLTAIEDYLNNCPIDLKLFELIRLRVAQLNGCAYCVDMHHKELKHLGESDLRMYSLCIWKEAPYYSEEERTVLLYTEALTYMNNEPLPPNVYDPLLNYYNKAEICYITLAISQINTWTRLMKSFKFEPGNYKVPN